MISWRCPLCYSPLHSNPQGITCVNRHQFDRAKEGYFNLLPVQQKNSLEPGDARQQLTARRHFLRAGYFNPLVEALLQVVPVNADSLLDIGCGEGFFTQAMASSLKNAQVFGIDIAKAGVRLAAKSGGDDHLHYAVASSHALPLADQAVACITRIYAPSNAHELRRVLRTDGLLIIVTPGETHLLALREQIYQNVRPHVAPETPDGFAQDCLHRVKLPLRVAPGEDTASLLEMTPFSWRLSTDLKSSLTDKGLIDSMDFVVSVYRPIPSGRL